MAVLDVNDVVRVVDGRSPYNGYIGKVVRVVAYDGRVSYFVEFGFLDRRCVRFGEKQLKTRSQTDREIHENGTDVEPTLVLDGSLAQQLLNRGISDIGDLGLQPRTYNLLRKNRIHTIWDLVGMEEKDLLRLRTFGRASLVDLRMNLVAAALALGDGAARQETTSQVTSIPVSGSPGPEVAPQTVTEAGQVPLLPDDSIDYLKLKTLTRNALVRNRIRTISGVSALSTEQLLGLRGFGIGSLEDLQQRLHAHTLGESRLAQTSSDPAMPEGESIYLLKLKPRTFTLLWRHQIRTISAMTALTEEQLLTIKGFGYQTLDDVKRQLNVHHLCLRRPIQEHKVSQLPLFHPQSHQESAEQFRELTNRLCAPFETQGLLKQLDLPVQLLDIARDAFEQHILTLSELRQLAAEPDLQSRFANWPYSSNRVKALQRVLTWLESAARYRSIDDEVNYLVSAFTDREKTILLNRFRLHETQTLEAIGNRYGVTRERVRQIEKRVQAKLDRRKSVMPLFYSRAALLILKHMDQDATLHLWKQRLVEAGYLVTDDSFDLCLAVGLASTDSNLSLSQELVASLRLGLPLSAAPYGKPLLRRAHGLCRKCGAVRLASLTDGRLSEANVARLLSSGGFCEIHPGWWSTDEGDSVPCRVAAKVLACCGPVSTSTMRHCLRRYLYRFQVPAPPSDVLAKALERTGEYRVEGEHVHLTKPTMRNPRLTAPERVFVQVVQTKGPIVPFESAYEELLRAGFSGATVSKVLSESPIVHKIAHKLYTLVGRPYDAVDVERARSELTRVSANATLRPRTDGVVEFETNIGNFMVYGGILGTGLAVQMQGKWTLIVGGQRRGEILVQRAFIQNLEPARDSLSLVAGDRIKIEFNTWTREATVRKVTKHDEAA